MGKEGEGREERQRESPVQPCPSGVVAKRAADAGDQPVMAPSLQAVLGSLPEGVLLVAHSGEVLLSNSLGQECLADRCIVDGEGRLAAVGEQLFVGLTSELARRRVLSHRVSSVDGERVFTVKITCHSVSPQASEGTASADWYSLIFREVTEEFKVREQLAQAERLSSLGELIGGIAHELNNSLTSVMGYAQLMIMEAEGQPREELSWIHSEANRSGRIVRKLLSLGRATRPERSMVSLNQLLDAAVDVLAYEMTARNIEVVRDLAIDLPETHADPHRLTQGFLNLLNNALQAISREGRQGVITLTTRLEEDHSWPSWPTMVRGLRPNSRAVYSSRSSRPRRRDKGQGWGSLTCMRSSRIMGDGSGWTVVHKEVPASRSGSRCRVVCSPRRSWSRPSTVAETSSRCSC